MSGADEGKNVPKGYVVPVEKITASGKGFSSLTGLEDIKKQLKRRFINTLNVTTGIVSPVPQNFLLLYGPPGTGKTSIARAIASEIASTLDRIKSNALLLASGEAALPASDFTAVDFINFDPQAAFGRLVGDSEKQVSAIFAKAIEIVSTQGTMAVIFMDEAESLMLSRTLSTDVTSTSVKTLVLMRMTALSEFNQDRQDKNLPGRVLFIAATNFPGRLDDAFLRRFETRTFVDLPSLQSRKDQIQAGLLASPFHMNLGLLELECLGHMTNLCSPSDIQQTLKTAQSLVPDLSLDTSAWFRFNERGKYEVVPLVDPTKPPCKSCPPPVFFMEDKPCNVCRSMYKMVSTIPNNLLETTCFIAIGDVVDIFSKQRPTLDEAAYAAMKEWHATKGSTT